MIVFSPVMRGCFFTYCMKRKKEKECKVSRSGIRQFFLFCFCSCVGFGGFDWWRLASSVPDATMVSGDTEEL